MQQTVQDVWTKHRDQKMNPPPFVSHLVQLSPWYFYLF